MSMSNRPTRFSDHQWERISEEAHYMGISASEFVREAACARVALAVERRLGPHLSLEDIVIAARERERRGS